MPWLFDTAIICTWQNDQQTPGFGLKKKKKKKKKEYAHPGLKHIFFINTV